MVGEQRTLAVRLRATIEAATDYYHLLDGVQAAGAREGVSDYIKNLDNIYL